MKTILFVNGANLSILGLRQPNVYGNTTLADITTQLSEYVTTYGVSLEDFCSNSEGEIVSFLNQNFIAYTKGKTLAGIVINPGAYTHTSIAIRDALEVFCEAKIPIFEVHLSNIFSRESFRHSSFISSIATGVICGLGAEGYFAAVRCILEKK